MIFVVIRKEIKVLFASYIGWGMLAIYAIVMGILYTQSLSEYMQVMMGNIPIVEQIGLTKYIGSNLFGTSSFIMLIFIPLLSMRLFSEEQKKSNHAFYAKCAYLACRNCSGEIFKLNTLFGADVSLLSCDYLHFKCMDRY